MMSNLKDQKLYTNDIRNELPWYRWGFTVMGLIFIGGLLWPHRFIGEFRFPSAALFTFYVFVYIQTVRRIRRLEIANARNEYVLDKEFEIATYDKDGNEVEEHHTTQ